MMDRTRVSTAFGSRRRMRGVGVVWCGVVCGMCRQRERERDRYLSSNLDRYGQIFFGAGAGALLCFTFLIGRRTLILIVQIGRRFSLLSSSFLLLRRATRKNCIHARRGKNMDCAAACFLLQCLHADIVLYIKNSSVCSSQDFLLDLSNRFYGQVGDGMRRIVSHLS